MTPSERIESALSESTRRRLEPEIMPEPEPGDFKNDGMRRKVFAGVIGVAAAVAVASVVALLLVNVFPKDRDAGQSSVAVPAAAARQAADAPKPALSQFRASVTPNAGQNLSQEQSERLLQQFVQWRQKAASTDTPSSVRE